MALSDRFRKQAETISSKRAQLAYERSVSISQEIIASDQFQLALDAGAMNMKEAVDLVLRRACDTIFDPVADFLDTMRSKDMPETFIRNYVHRLYIYIYGTESKAVPEYEEMLADVAAYMVEHPEMYMSIKDTSGTELMNGMGSK